MFKGRGVGGEGGGEGGGKRGKEGEKTTYIAANIETTQELKYMNKKIQISLAVLRNIVL